VDVLFAPNVLPPGHRGRAVVLNLGIYEGAHAIPGSRARLRSRHLAYSARRADAVIAISSTTREDLVEFYGIPRQKISVVWPGLDPRFRPGEPGDSPAVAGAVERALGEVAPYFLSVGRASRRRNVPALLAAVARLREAGKEARLLLVGPGTGQYLRDGAVKQLGIDDAVSQLDFLELDELALLYRAATALVMPTPREGFSVPILEAMASGCPVITVAGARLGVLDYLAEAVGDYSGAVLAAADERPTALAAAMGRLLENPGLGESLRETGLGCAAAFPSWEEHATGVLDVLARVAADGASAG
jgi:glycosyltransferase involved in cell wall biosynthesis